VPRPYSKIIKFDLERQVAKFSDTIEIPLRQFQGVMAVAPTKERGKLGSSPPYPDIGGNFDNKWLGRGATIYFPVQVEGALFQTGDPHAAQGNGEVSITAIESSNTVTVQFIVHKDMPLKVCRAETPTHYICMGLDVELNLAMRMAITQTLEFLKEKKGLEFFDALSLASVGVDFEVTQVVDTTKGIHAMIPKSIFKDSTATAYWYSATNTHAFTQ
jgi:acetamidase/formamidase